MMGKSEGRDVYSSSFTEASNTLFVFFNKDEHGISSYIVLIETRWNNRDVGIIKRTWTRDDLQKKGYLSGLAKFINSYLKLSIMSDEEQTPSSMDFWKSLAKRMPVKVADLQNTNIVTNISDDDIYKDDTPSQYRFFIESVSLYKEIKEWVEPILQPYHYFTDGDI